MKTHLGELLGLVERETITYTLRSRLVIVDETAVLTDGEGVVHTITEGCRLLVVDPVGLEQPVVDALLDMAELDVHHAFGFAHNGAQTRTPLDLRTPEYGGREDSQEVPF